MLSIAICDTLGDIKHTLNHCRDRLINKPLNIPFNDPFIEFIVSFHPKRMEMKLDYMHSLIVKPMNIRRSILYARLFCDDDELDGDIPISIYRCIRALFTLEKNSAQRISCVIDTFRLTVNPLKSHVAEEVCSFCSDTKPVTIYYKEKFMDILNEFLITENIELEHIVIHHESFRLVFSDETLIYKWKSFFMECVRKVRLICYACYSLIEYDKILNGRTQLICDDIDK